MNIWIAAFLAFGASFGLLSFSRRHLFSEGPHRPQAGADTDAPAGRLMWVLVCTFLWPLMLVSGLNTAWVLLRRRQRRTR